MPEPIAATPLPSAREIKLEVAIHEAVEVIESDLLAYATRGINSQELFRSVREVNEKLKEVSGYVG